MVIMKDVFLFPILTRITVSFSSSPLKKRIFVFKIKAPRSSEYAEMCHSMLT